MKRSLSIFLLGSLFVLVSSCYRHRYHILDSIRSGSLHILFDWNGYTEIPPGMNLMFYPIIDEYTNEGDYAGSPILYQLQYDGGVVSLPVGRYNVAIYSDYTYQIRYRGMEYFHTAEVWLEDYNRLPLSSRLGTTRNVAEPDIYYVAQLFRLQVTTSDNERVVTVFPELKTLRLFIHVGINGIQNISMADGGISGASASIMLATGEAPDNISHNRLFPLALTDEELYAESRMFLLPNRATSCRYVLELAFLLRNNSVSMGKYSFDVSDQIIPILERTSGRIPPEGIHIYLRDVTVDEVASGGGFDAVVDEWGNEIDIELN